MDNPLNGVFKCYKEYESKLATFLDKNNLLEKFEGCRLRAIEIMISKFKLTSSEDMDQLAFLMWMLKKDFEILLNAGKIPIDLDYIRKMILTVTPSAKIVGRLCANFTESLPFYDCLKFVGQFTNSQTVYDKCLEILYAMPEKLEGMISSPSQVAHLMGYNKYVDTSNNKYKGESKEILQCFFFAIDKLSAFNKSIYQPRPDQSRQYDRYKTAIEQIYHIMTDNAVGCICFTNYILRGISWEFDFDKIRFNPQLKLSEVALERIRQHLLDVSQCEPKIKALDLSLKVEETFRFLTRQNEQGINRILSNACIYISDEKSKEETLERTLMEQIYERQIADVNSKVSHNFMRMAAEDGRLWIVKFLIEKGCPVKNLPKYDKRGYNWLRENQQILEILKEKVKDNCGFGHEWKKQRTKDKLAVLTYLTSNNLL